MKVHFKLISGEEIKHEITKSQFTIGRSSKCDLCLPFDGFSRIHCQIELSPEGEIFITDLGSVNGIFIDGKKIEPHRRVPYSTLLPLDIGPAEVSIFQDEAVFKPLSPSPKETHSTQIPQQTVQTAKKIYRPPSVETPKKSIKNLGFVFFIVIAFFAYKEIQKIGSGNESDDAEISRLQFEQMKKNQKSDGSIQTKDF